MIGSTFIETVSEPKMEPSPANTPPDSFSTWIPTRWILWPLTGPFYAWLSFIIGMLLASRVDPRKGLPIDTASESPAT